MNKQPLIITGVVVAIVVLAGWSYYQQKTPDNPNTPNQQPASPSTDSPETTPPASVDVVSKTRVPRPLTPSARYQQAITTYGDQGNRHIIQLDETCHGVPGTLLIKQGLNFMIDNRSELEISVRYEDQSFNILPWDFRIVTTQIPGKHFITCEGGGAAEVTVAP